MKLMAMISLVVAGSVGITALVLKSAGVTVHPMDPIAAAIVAAAAGMAGMLPMLRIGQPDGETIAMRALAGTVVHLLCTGILAAVLVGSHAVSIKGAFPFWLLGAYWVSLVALVGQLKKVLLEMTANLASLKVQN
jgi:hypothetical protein